MHHRQAVSALTLLVLVFSLVFTSLLHMRHKAFVSHDWRDEAVDNQIIYNSAKGKLVYSTIKGPMIFHRHFRPIFIVCAIPRVIINKIQVWFATVGVVLGLGAFAVYGFARRRFRSVNIAFGFAVAYLLWPPLHEVALGNYDPETLVATFWLFAILAFDAEKMIAFWGWALMALICKETQAFVLFGFGIVGAIQRKSLKWWLPPLIVGPAWFFIALKVIIPLYHPSFGTIYGRFVGCQTGDLFPACFIDGMVNNTMQSLGQIFSKEHLHLIVTLMRSTFFVPMIGLEWLIPTGPILLEIFLLNQPHPARQTHILSAMIAFIFVGGIVGSIRLSSFIAWVSGKRIRKISAQWAILAIFITLGIIFNFTNGLFGKWQDYGKFHDETLTASSVFDRSNFHVSEDEKIAWKTIDTIPEEASAMTNNRFLLPLSDRMLLMEFGTQKQLSDFDPVEYLLISFTQPKCRSCTYNRLSVENLNLLLQLVESGRFKVMCAFDDHGLLVRKDLPEAIEDPAAREKIIAVIHERIKELAAEAASAEVGEPPTP